VGRRFNDRDRGDRDRSRNLNRSSRDRNGDRSLIRKRGPQEDDVCHNCGKTGHW